MGGGVEQGSFAFSTALLTCGIRLDQIRSNLTALLTCAARVACCVRAWCQGGVRCSISIGYLHVAHVTLEGAVCASCGVRV